MKEKFVVLVALLAASACSSSDPSDSADQGGGGGSSGTGGGMPLPDVDCAKTPDACYVRVQDGRFTLDGRPYRYMGTNFWAAPYISMDRLRGELDLLKSQGVTNLRIMALSEGGIPDSQKNDPAFGPQQIHPASSDEPCTDPVLEASAEHLKEVLDELDARGMKAVLTLNDWYHWSGGMPQYMKWAHEQPTTSCGEDHSSYILDGARDAAGASLFAVDHHVPFSSSTLFAPATGDACTATPTGDFVIPHPNTVDPTSPDLGKAWDDQQDISTLFLCNGKAQEFFFSRAATVIKQLKDHPAVTAWQLANEPRSFRGWSAVFRLWVEKTAKFIKDIDPNHLISIGAEGELYMWGDYANSDYRAFNDLPNVDYLTFHVWPENWGWYDPALPADSLDAGSLTSAIDYSDEFVAVHLEHARALNKPIVVEEFGLARDDKESPVTSSVTKRNAYYENLFTHVRDNQELGGVNFWAWAGAGRPADDGNPYWRLGNDYLGDPPHEQQGWYSVYSTDAETLALITRYAGLINPAP